MEPVEKYSVDELNLSDLEFWALPHEVREGAFKTLRRERPIAYFDLPEVDVPGVDPSQFEGGAYVLTKYKDIVDASRQPGASCSGRSTTTCSSARTPSLVSAIPNTHRTWTTPCHSS